MAIAVSLQQVFIFWENHYFYKHFSKLTSNSKVESTLILHYPQYKKLYLVHQLDFVTSGIHIWALSKRSASKAGKLFLLRKVRKTYVAVLRGWVSNDWMLISKNIAKEDESGRRMCVGDRDNPGKAAVTELTVLRRGYLDPELPSPPTRIEEDPSIANYVPKDPLPVTMVQLQPITGRTHQLRVHTASISHPIIGDYLYETPYTEYAPRTMLHAWKLWFPYPGNEMQLETNNPFADWVI
ncbi:RNA pseudouridylate synthase domain-containing protein 1 [Nowakowskiella sp. JEL0407]|nr:RNA pseudouridylate synthase domain-containing protein 1 [Nowakowskiella sp. JEL0407]